MKRAATVCRGSNGSSSRPAASSCSPTTGGSSSTGAATSSLGSTVLMSSRSDFDYDARGNLVEARREGDARVESYAYDFIGRRDVLTGVTNELNGADNRLRLQRRDLRAGRRGRSISTSSQRLTEPEGGVTQFFYDTAALAANTEPLTTWVRDPRDHDTTPPHGRQPGRLRHHLHPQPLRQPHRHHRPAGPRHHDALETRRRASWTGGPTPTG